MKQSETERIYTASIRYEKQQRIKAPLVYRIAALLLLASFVFASCSPAISSLLENPPPSGLFVFLDTDNNPIDYDRGRLALLVENEPELDGILIVSEVEQNHPDNDAVVWVLNSNNDSVVSMAYRSGEAFPYRMAITIDGYAIRGEFTDFDPKTGQFTIKLTSLDDSETDYITGTLGVDVADIYQRNPDLTTTQNARLRAIMTTLHIWDAVSAELEEIDFYMERSWRRSLRNVARVFRAISVVATIVAPFIPAVGPIIATTVRTAAVTLSVLTVIFPPNEEGGPHDISEQPRYRRPTIEVRLRGYERPLGNNELIGDPRYIPHGDYLAFEVTITDMGLRGGRDNRRYEIISEEAEERFIVPVNPPFCEESWGMDVADMAVLNNGWNIWLVNYSHHTVSDKIETFVVTRRSEGMTHVFDGGLRFVLRFRQAVIINGAEYGGYTWRQPEGSSSFFLQAVAPDSRDGHLFVLNFTVRAAAQGDTP